MKTHFFPVPIFLAFCVVTACHPNDTPTRPAANVAVDPISGILSAFDSHSIVALDEGNHGNQQGHAFRLSLIRDPRFPKVVNDIVVEFGSARYQDLMDRFVQGENVPESELRKVWQDTTQSHDVWDSPLYEEFFRAVREINSSLPANMKLRVLLGDPAVNWDGAQKVEDLGNWDRDGHAADVIRKEVLAKNRRALVIYGGMHFLRKEIFSFPPNVPLMPPMLVGRLESLGIKTFSIWTYNYGGDIAALQPEIASWHKPSLTKLRGTILGAKEFAFYYPHEANLMREGKVTKIKPRPELTMEEEFDALLYLGPTSTITNSELPAKLCADPEYIKMRMHRIKLMGSPDWAADFKKRCEEIVAAARAAHT